MVFRGPRTAASIAGKTPRHDSLDGARQVCEPPSRAGKPASRPRCWSSLSAHRRNEPRIPRAEHGDCTPCAREQTTRIGLLSLEHFARPNTTASRLCFWNTPRTELHASITLTLPFIILPHPQARIKGDTRARRVPVESLGQLQVANQSACGGCTPGRAAATPRPSSRRDVRTLAVTLPTGRSAVES